MFKKLGLINKKKEDKENVSMVLTKNISFLNIRIDNEKKFICSDTSFKLRG